MQIGLNVFEVWLNEFLKEKRNADVILDEGSSRKCAVEARDEKFKFWEFKILVLFSYVAWKLFDEALKLLDSQLLQE